MPSVKLNTISYLLDFEKFDAQINKAPLLPALISRVSDFQVEIKSNTLFKNRIAILKMAHQRMLRKLRKPVDKEE